jgi:hypothetical protein
LVAVMRRQGYRAVDAALAHPDNKCALCPFGFKLGTKYTTVKMRTSKVSIEARDVVVHIKCARDYERNAKHE